MNEVVEMAVDALKADKCIFQVLNTVSAATIALTGKDLSVDNAKALLKVLNAAEQRLQEITGSGL